jgi:CBS domain containing-hemolysin-like protein
MVLPGTFDVLVRLSAVLALVALNAFFVAAEFALVSARPTRLDQLVSSGNATAALGRRMQADLDRYIAAAQLGITLASLGLGWIGEETISALIEPPIEWLLDYLLGVVAVAHDLAVKISRAVGVAVSFFIITTLHIVLGEQAPKVFAIRAPERSLLFVARPLTLFNRVFGLVIRFLDWATTSVLRLLGMRATSEHTKVHSAEELRLLVEESAEAGVLATEEQEMLINVFAFADRPAHHAMVPRPEVLTIERDATVQTFLDRFAETGHTRFPVLGGGGIDDIQGVISAKDLLVALRDGALRPEQPISSLVRPAFFVPESKRTGALLEELRSKPIRMAILIDEYGGMAGIVTMEDLVEEIIGDLDDEIERNATKVVTIDMQTTVVEGQMRVEEINAALDLNIPQGEYETMAGFILSRLGRLPTAGDQLVYQRLCLTVVEMQGPRIKRIEIKRM